MIHDEATRNDGKLAAGIPISELSFGDSPMLMLLHGATAERLLCSDGISV